MLKFCFFLFATMIFIGCETVPPLEFTPRDIEVSKTNVNAGIRRISVSIASESERVGRTDVGFGGNIYEISFKDTLEDALDEALIRSTIFNDSSSRTLLLAVKVLQFETPPAGITFDTNATIRYDFISTQTGETIFSKTIKSFGNVSPEYAFLGATRYTEARNIAIRNNISKLLQSIEPF